MTIWFRVSPCIPLCCTFSDRHEKEIPNILVTVRGQMAFQSHSTGKEPAPATPTVTLSFFLMSLPKAIANPSKAASKIARHRRNFTTAKAYSVLISKKTAQEVFLKEYKKCSVMYSNQAIKTLAHWFLFRSRN